MPIDPIMLKRFHQRDLEKKTEQPAEQAEQPKAIIKAPSPATLVQSTQAPLKMEEPPAAPAASTAPVQDVESLQRSLSVQSAESRGELVETATREERIGQFKSLLDNFDQLINSEFGIHAITQDKIRGYVKEVMQTLQTEPELDAILIDRDVHNILFYIRSTKDKAIETRAVAKEKKAVKAKKAGRFKDFDLDSIGLTLPVLGGLKT